jgi:hypothetical protein
MLTNMEVFTSGVSVPPLPIVDQPEALDPIQIKRIDGLGPVKASVNTTQYGSIDGEEYSGAFTPKRNIVLTLALNPNWAAGQSIESIRQILYLYFMPQNSVRLRFTSTHLSTVEISGYVESCEPDMFSDDPEYQVSIICPKPYFVATRATVLTGTTQVLTGTNDVTLNYEGSASVGFVVDVTLPTGGSSFSGEVRIQNATPSLKIASILPVTVSSAQFFRWSSVQGDKFARQYPIPTGAPTDVLKKVAVGSGWLTLRKGPNKIRVLSATAGLNWAISYYARYGGL